MLDCMIGTGPLVLINSACLEENDSTLNTYSRRFSGNVGGNLCLCHSSMECRTVLSRLNAKLLGLSERHAAGLPGTAPGATPGALRNFALSWEITV